MSETKKNLKNNFFYEFLLRNEIFKLTKIVSTKNYSMTHPTRISRHQAFLTTEKDHKSRMLKAKEAWCVAIYDFSDFGKNQDYNSY